MGKIDAAQMRSALIKLSSRKLPPLGDPSRVFPLELTEPEINGIYACVAFVKQACVIEPFTNFWDHYGPAMQGLSDRLTVFDDPPAASETAQEE